MTTGATEGVTYQVIAAVMCPRATLYKEQTSLTFILFLNTAQLSVWKLQELQMLHQISNICKLFVFVRLLVNGEGSSAMQTR